MANTKSSSGSAFYIIFVDGGPEEGIDAIDSTLKASIGTDTRSAKVYRTPVIFSEMKASAFDSEGAFISTLETSTLILQEQNERQKETMAMLREQIERQKETYVRASRAERETP
jgi:hypothetical protein